MRVFSNYSFTIEIFIVAQLYNVLCYGFNVAYVSILWRR